MTYKSDFILPVLLHSIVDLLSIYYLRFGAVAACTFGALRG